MKKNIIIIILLGVIFSSFVENDSVFLRNMLVHSYMEGYRYGTVNSILNKTDPNLFES